MPGSRATRLRARNNEFKLDELRTGIQEAHALGKKLFVASNLMPHNAKVKTYMADMEPVIAMQPDALIMADPGLIAMVRERWPEQEIHLSVQANTVNYAAVKFWKSLGLSRVILSRELSLDEIEEIRQQCPDIELEVFVHGALCIAYSGRCLLSGYFNHRDANQGTCTNSCRWDYKVDSADENGTGEIQKIDFDFDKALSESELSDCGSQPRHPLADKVYVISRKDHPGELMPVLEDEHGTYIMNSKDLRAVEHVERLVKIGVDSLKVEGRTKSIYYVARTAQVYRQAIDDAVERPSVQPGTAGRAGCAGQPRLHRRFLRTPPHPRAAELPARPFREFSSTIRRRHRGLCQRHRRDRGEEQVPGRRPTGDHPSLRQPYRAAHRHAKSGGRNAHYCPR